MRSSVAGMERRSLVVEDDKIVEVEPPGIAVRKARCTPPGAWMADRYRYLEEPSSYDLPPPLHA